MIERTRMFSLNPGTPGRRQQMPRTIRSIWTPAWDAAYSSSMSSASTRLFIFRMMRPRPSPTLASLAMSSRSRGRRSRGDTSSLSKCMSRP